jgi:hypothetical protein
MDLEETEGRSNYAGEGQQQFNRSTDSTAFLVSSPAGFMTIFYRLTTLVVPLTAG